jgi:hypothetical protein
MNEQTDPLGEFLPRPVRFLNALGPTFVALV